METKLRFRLTLVTGEKVEQELSVPEQVPVVEAIHQTLIQYAQIGMLRKDGDTFSLTAASQIIHVEVDLPSIIVAGPQEAEKVLGKISLV